MKNAAILIPVAAGLLLAAANTEPPTAGVTSSPVSPSSVSDDASGAAYNPELWELREAAVAHEQTATEFQNLHKETQGRLYESIGQAASLEKELATTKMQLLALQEEERLRQEKVAKGECLCGGQCRCKQPVYPAPLQQQRPTWNHQGSYQQPVYWSNGACASGNCGSSGRRLGGIF